MQFYGFVFDRGKKSRFGFVNNLRYIFREMHHWNKLCYAACVFGFLPLIAASFLETILPARLVADLEAGVRLPELLFHLGALSILAWACNTVYGIIREYHETVYENFTRYLQKKYIQKMMDVDYDRLENQEFQKIAGNAVNTVTKPYTLWFMCEAPTEIGRLLLGVLYAGFLCAVNPWLAAVVLFTEALSIGLLGVARKQHSKYHKDLSIYNRKVRYFNSQSNLSSAGKDIRIYKMRALFLEKFKEALDAIGAVFGKIHTWYTARSLADAVFAFLRNGFIYAYLLYQLVQKNISPAEFVFYVGLINGLEANLGEALHTILFFNTTSVAVDYMRQLLGYASPWKRGEGVGERALGELLAAPVTLELKDVSFTYSGSRTPVISHLNLKIEAGEKLALIGLNGAGKTTLVKLICGFYHPTEGEILVNQIPREQFSREEYSRIMAVQFQDAVFLPVTLDENITAQPGGSREEKRLHEAVRYSGFAERYRMLKDEGETLLVKEVNEKATDFSGGEKQKIMFARALYKNAPLMILDEPTAALDPIAENELYLNFNEASRNKTVIYISHRLSSTRFCDRIILLQDGHIVEEGTHEQLMRQGTVYANLFQMQSQYYKDKKEDEARRRSISKAFGEEEYVE